MLRSYSIFPVFLFSLAGLAWWSGKVESKTWRPEFDPHLPKTESAPLSSASHTARRLELIETLDRAVAYEHYYHSVYGHYTQILSRIGVSLSREISDVYEIHVSEVSRDRFVVSATWELEGKVADRVSVDQEYRILANFELPTPRPEYLRMQAFKHLRQLRDGLQGTDLAESGIFHGYYRYEVKTEGADRRQAFAVGIRAPVEGTQLSLGTAEDMTPQLEDGASPKTGQWANSKGMMSTLEEAYLAQRIFRGETGRYAKDWAELSKIAGFRFENRDKLASRTVPFGDSGPAPEVEAFESTAESTAREPSSLEIEPVDADEVGQGPAKPAKN